MKTERQDAFLVRADSDRAASLLADKPAFAGPGLVTAVYG